MGPSPWGGLREWGEAKIIFLSDYGHVAYQIKADNVCSNMVANILHTDTPLTESGVKRSSQIFLWK